MSTGSKTPKLLTVRQIADMIAQPLWTVRALTERGPPHMKLGSRFFTEDAVTEWFAANQVSVKKTSSSKHG